MDQHESPICACQFDSPEVALRASVAANNLIVTKATRQIVFRVDSSLYSIRRSTPYNNEQLRHAVIEGFKWFADWFDVRVVMTTDNALKPILVVATDDLRKYRMPYDAWGGWDPQLRRIVLNNGKTWPLTSIPMFVAHEYGHASMTLSHWDHLDDYYVPPGQTNTRYSHVMKRGAASHFQYALSPLEVWWCIHTDRFTPAARAVHPLQRDFARMNDTDKKNNLAKLKQIVLEYWRLRAKGKPIIAKLYNWQT